MKTRLNLAITGAGMEKEKYRDELSKKLEAVYETVEKMVVEPRGKKVVMEVVVQVEETEEQVGWIELEVKR